MMTRTPLTRRGFLGRAAAGAGALLALPAGTYNRAFGMADTDKPSERIRIGCIGVGNQGRGNMRKHIKNVTAVCEVDRKRLEEAAAQVQKATGRPPLAVGDYRKLLDSKDVDAVVITTPDHWHALPTIDAC
ncbi:MAG TPA: Gfo/Idh/MocA family oxidoreductase, partial [Gemmataceae bacterium]